MKIWLRLIILTVALLAGCDRIKDAESGTPSSASSSGAHVSDLDASNYDGFISQEGRLSVVEYHATWCPPCKSLAPLLESVAAEFEGRVKIGKVDVDRARDLALGHQVRGIPDVRLFRGGRQVEQFVGLIDEAAIREMLAEHSVGFEAVAPVEGDGEAVGLASPTRIQTAGNPGPLDESAP